MSEKAKVWIVWSPDGDLDNLRVLSFGDGSSRVYDRDNYDGRVDLGRDDASKPVPYFRTRARALAFLCAHPGEQCQIDIRTQLFAD